MAKKPSNATKSAMMIAPTFCMRACASASLYNVAPNRCQLTNTNRITSAIKMPQMVVRGEFFILHSSSRAHRREARRFPRTTLRQDTCSHLAAYCTCARIGNKSSSFFHHYIFQNEPRPPRCANTGTIAPIPVNPCAFAAAIPLTNVAAGISAERSPPYAVNA